MSSSNFVERSFDVSDMADTIYVHNLRFRWRGCLVTFAVLAVFGAVSVGQAVLGILNGAYVGRVEADGVLAAFGFVLGSLILFSANHTYRHPAVRLNLENDGIRVVYPNGRTTRKVWSHPRFRMKIGKMSAERFSGPLGVVSFWWRPMIFMPEDVATAIVETARTRGLRVESITDPSSTQPATLIRAAGPTRTASGRAIRPSD